jgi:hypothetical protein
MVKLSALRTPKTYSRYSFRLPVPVDARSKASHVAKYYSEYINKAGVLDGKTKTYLSITLPKYLKLDTPSNILSHNFRFWICLPFGLVDIVNIIPYLFTPSLAQNIQCRMSCWFIKNNLRVLSEKAVVSGKSEATFDITSVTMVILQIKIWNIPNKEDDY